MAALAELARGRRREGPGPARRRRAGAGHDAKAVAAACLDAGLVRQRRHADRPAAGPAPHHQRRRDRRGAWRSSPRSWRGTVRHFLEIDDLSAAELADVLDRAEERHDHGSPLAGQGVALLFIKPSLRTRHSCEMGVIQLGGHPISVRPDEVGVNDREPPQDIARVLAGYHRLLGGPGRRPRRRRGHGRTRRHPGGQPALRRRPPVPGAGRPADDAPAVRRWPRRSDGGLDRRLQQRGPLAGRGAALSGMAISLGCPTGYGPDDAEVERLTVLGAAGVQVHPRPHGAAKGADAVHTDVWTSMGFEAEAEARNRAFEGFIVDDSVMAEARRRCRVHALPARPPRRGGGGVGHRRPGQRRHPAGPQPPAQLPGRRLVARPRSARDARRDAQISGTAGGGCRLAKHQRQHRVARLLEHHAVTSPAAAGRPAGRTTAWWPPRPRCPRPRGARAPSRCGPAAATPSTPSPSCPRSSVAPEDHLRRVLGEWVVEVAHSGNLGRAAHAAGLGPRRRLGPRPLEPSRRSSVRSPATTPSSSWPPSASAAPRSPASCPSSPASSPKEPEP